MFRFAPGRAAAVFLFAGCLLSGNSHAQAEEEAVVVSASRTQQRIRDAIPHTTVLTRKDIRDSQATDLPSLLQREAGFEFTQNGGIGGLSGVFMRGGRSAQALILVDGVRVEDAAAGTTAIQHLLLDQIERVEIVRGNVSSLYGSGAIGGVVQVFTRRGSGTPAPSAEVTLGARGTSKLTAGFGGEHGSTRFQLSATRFETRGFSAIDPRLAPNANPDPDGYRNDSVSGTLSHRVSPRHEFGGSFLASRGRVDYDNAFDARADIHVSTQDLGMGRVYWEGLPLERWKSRVTLSEGTDYRTDSKNGAVSSRSNTRSRQFAWDNDVRFLESQQASVGIEQLRQALDNSSATVQKRRREVSVLRAGYLGRFGAHSLQANLRGEDYSDFGRASTHLFGYGLDLTDEWRLTASASTAFRAPTFLDLYGFGGNAALRPERARTGELGIQWASGSHRLRVVAFDTKYTDAIAFDNVTSSIRNVRKASVNGVESSYSGQVAGFDLRASVTVQDPVEQDPGQQELQAVRRAKQYGALSVHRSVGSWRFGADIAASADRRDTDIVSGASLREGGYTRVNLTARYQFDKSLHVAAKLENAFDEQYRLVHGYNTPRRGLFLTLGWHP